MVQKFGLLQNGQPFEVVNKARVWHPNSNARIDDPLNRKFINEIVDRVMDDEKVCAPVYLSYANRKTRVGN